MSQLDEAYQHVQRFKQNALKTRISTLEDALQGSSLVNLGTLCSAEGIGPSLWGAARILKKASSQIDEVVHAIGILVSLPYLMHDGEIIESVSLAAGNTGKPFDLETNLRVAEFKFIAWKGGSESIRQNQLFKDFYALAEIDTPKDRYLYVVGAEQPLKFLESKRKLSSVMSHENKLWQEFQSRYETQFTTVNQYYAQNKKRVNIVDLAKIIPDFAFEIEADDQEKES